MNLDNYYERGPSIEGIAAAFDLFGANSSFHFPGRPRNETSFEGNTIENNFQKVGGYLCQAINSYNFTSTSLTPGTCQNNGYFNWEMSGYVKS